MAGFGKGFLRPHGLAVVQVFFAAQRALGVPFAGEAVAVAAGVGAVFFARPIAVHPARRALQAPVLQRLFAQAHGAVSVGAAHEAAFAGGGEAVGRVHGLARQLALGHGVRRAGQQEPQQRSQCGAPAFSGLRQVPHGMGGPQQRRQQHRPGQAPTGGSPPHPAARAAGPWTAHARLC